jgi:hypothetical protein
MLTKMLGALTTKIFSNYAKLLQRAGHTLVAGFRRVDHAEHTSTRPLKDLVAGTSAFTVA